MAGCSRGKMDGEMVVTDLISRRTVLQRTNAWQPVFAHHGARLAFVEWLFHQRRDHAFGHGHTKGKPVRDILASYRDGSVHTG